MTSSYVDQRQSSDSLIGWDKEITERICMNAHL
jgi:hypothetical protein